MKNLRSRTQPRPEKRSSKTIGIGLATLLAPVVIALGFLTTTASGQGLGAPEFTSSMIIQNPLAFVVQLSNYGFSPIEICDWNNDGNIDIVATSEPLGVMLVHEGDGNGLFTSSNISFGAGQTPVSIVGADFNQDGVTDFALCNGTAGNVTIMNSQGTNQFSVSTIATGSKPVRAYASDLTQDGKLDLVVVDEIDSTVGLLVGDGSGNFGAPQISFVEVDDTLEALAIGDVNDDGLPDLIVPCPVFNVVAVLLATGGGAFQPPAMYPVGVNPGPVAIDDLDGDGTQDVLVPNRNETSLSLLRGAGNGTFLAAESITSPESPVCARSIKTLSNRSLGTYPHQNSSAVSVVAETGGSTVSTMLTTAGTADWVESADFNGDGFGDIAVVSRVNGTIEVFLQVPAEFLRGDVNGDGSLSIVDFLAFMQTINSSASSPECLDRYDANDDGTVGLSDPVTILGRLYLNQPTLPTPSQSCGIDPTPDSLPDCYPTQDCID